MAAGRAVHIWLQTRRGRLLFFRQGVGGGRGCAPTLTDHPSGANMCAAGAVKTWSVMSILNWLVRQPRPAPAARPAAPARPAGPRPSVDADASARRKAERAAHRDLIFTIVRESMVRCGILSTRYKFKVMSADMHGHEFIVMVDLPREFMDEPVRLSEIEELVSRSAQARHELVVRGIYWRHDPALNAGDAPAAHRWNTPVAPRTPQSAPPSAPAAAAGPTNYALLTGYESTEMFDPDAPDPGMRTAALSATQHGELH